jgi:hypothetical protein
VEIERAMSFTQHFAQRLHAPSTFPMCIFQRKHRVRKWKFSRMRDVAEISRERFASRLVFIATATSWEFNSIIMYHRMCMDNQFSYRFTFIELQ